MKKTLLGVVLAPVLACLVGGVAIADTGAFKGEDGFFYATGLRYGFKYRVNNSAQTATPVTATANACGFIKLPAAKFNTNSGATVLTLDGYVTRSTANLTTQKPPLCKNGVAYFAKEPEYSSYLRVGQDGALYGWGLWANTSYQVRNLSAPKKRVVTADACGVVSLSFSQSYPLSNSDTINVVAPSVNSVTIANLPIVPRKVTCASGGIIYPAPPSPQSKFLTSSGALYVYLTGFQSGQKVTIAYPSVAQSVTVNSNSCGMIRVPASSRFSLKVGDSIRVLAPDGWIHADAQWTGDDPQPMCKNGVFYVPEMYSWSGD